MVEGIAFSPARLSGQARSCVANMFQSGAPAVVQFENGERRAYIRDRRNREKRVDVSAIEELAKAGVLAERHDGLFAGLSQTLEPRVHAILGAKTMKSFVDKATGSKFRRVQVDTTAGKFFADVLIRQGKLGAEVCDADAAKARAVELLLAGKVERAA